MMLPGWAAMAFVSAVLIALPDEVLATTSTMFALGAMACAHCTSRLVSMLQPNSSWWVLFGLNVGQPVPHSTVNEGGSGRWKMASKSCRSCWTVGLPKASTMRMVWPLPSRVEGTSYALRIERGMLQLIVAPLLSVQVGVSGRERSTVTGDASGFFG